MFRQRSEMFRQQKTPKPPTQTRYFHYYRGDLRILSQFCSSYSSYYYWILGTSLLGYSLYRGDIVLLLYMLRNHLFILNEPPELGHSIRDSSTVHHNNKAEFLELLKSYD